MDDQTATLVGLSLGLIGVLAGLAVPLMMLRGTFSRVLAVKPRPYVAPVPKAALLERLLALNDPGQPFSYRPDDKYDLRAEWRLADTAWWGFFQRNRLLATYLARVNLNDPHREARVYEERGRLEWSAGTRGLVPRVSWQKSFFKGVVLFERSREIAYGMKSLDPVDWGKVVDYDFDVWRVKGPILTTVTESGWSFVPVVHEHQLRADRQLAK